MAEFWYLGKDNSVCEIAAADAFPFLKESGHIVSFVGGGGKTTLMYLFAGYCSQRGMRTLVTTTTHIFRPDASVFAENKDQVLQLWKKGSYAVVGAAEQGADKDSETGEELSFIAGTAGLKGMKKNGQKREKLRRLPKQELQQYFALADIVLIEADGAKGFGCKAPAEHEPVLLPECDIVIGLAGINALGQSLRDACFRTEKAMELLQVTEETHRLREEDLAKILCSDAGGRKLVGSRTYYAVLNQCDTKQRRAAGAGILHMVTEQGSERAVMASLINRNGNRVMKKMTEKLIIVRGGGDLATGTIHRLWSAGFRVLVLETEHPAAIRRQVSVCEAVYDQKAEIEGMRAALINNTEEMETVFSQGAVPVLVDAKGSCIAKLQPEVVVDAILAKKNLGTNRSMANLTIGLGPGFEAGADVDVVIETMRGHNLGRIIRRGSAKPNTGVPGVIGGYASERVIHAQAAGVIRNIHQIGDTVEQGETIAVIETGAESLSVTATIPGLLRGLIRDGYEVTEGFKIADIDPRKTEYENVFTISDKARCIAGSVLEVVCRYITDEQ